MKTLSVVGEVLEVAEDDSIYVISCTIFRDCMVLQSGYYSAYCHDGCCACCGNL